MKHPFLLFAIIFGIFIGAAAVPSPLYEIFQYEWHFSATILTTIFAVYAGSLLLALLTVGSLSDYIGRRPVLISALLIEALSMIVFASARGVAWLIAARLLQGFATGIASSVISAGLIDTQPRNRPGLAPLISTAVPVGSLGVGALITSLLAAYGPAPTHLIFWVVCSACLLAATGTFLSPESAPRKPGWLSSFAPTIALPAEAKRPLFQVGSSLIAVWAQIGLFSSLGPSIAAALLHSHMYAIGGLVVLALTATGATSSLLLRHQTEKRLVTIGAVASSLGLSIVVLGILSSMAILFFIGTIVAGIGFGPAFTGSFRSIMNRAPTDQRAGLASTVYIISYVAMSIPAVLAGIATTKTGLHPTVIAYCLIIVSLYLLALVLSHVVPQFHQKVDQSKKLC